MTSKDCLNLLAPLTFSVPSPLSTPPFLLFLNYVFLSRSRWNFPQYLRFNQKTLAMLWISE